MDSMEQTMLQLWFSRLVSLIDEGEIAKVREELQMALGRIKEDRTEHGLVSEPEPT